jgi:hypothetical protein
MAAKKKSPAKKSASSFGLEDSRLARFLVITFTVLSVVYVGIAYWRYG